MAKRRPVVEAAAPGTRNALREAAVADQPSIKAPYRPDRKALRRWYAEELQPHLSRMSPAEIASGAAVGRSYAYYIVAGTRIPNPRHYPSLAALAGVELPTAITGALSMSVTSGKSGHSPEAAHASA
jgi:hypothetical protein